MNELVVSVVFSFISFVDFACFVRRDREKGFHFVGICWSQVSKATKEVEALHWYKKGTTSLKCSNNQISYLWYFTLLQNYLRDGNIQWVNEWWNASGIIFCFQCSANLSKLINLYSPWNYQKTYCFLMISGGKEVN